MKTRAIKLIASLIIVSITIPLFYQIYLNHRNRSSYPERQARGYLRSASDEIANALIESGDNNVITKNPEIIKTIDKYIASSPDFGFPGSFLGQRLRSGLVTSGFVRSDYRKYSFELAALWRETTESRWHKISLIKTLDKDEIWESKEIVDNQWLEENLIPFPSPQSATFKMIEDFNREKVEKQMKDRVE